MLFESIINLLESKNFYNNLEDRYGFNLKTEQNPPPILFPNKDVCTLN